MKSQLRFVEHARPSHRQAGSCVLFLLLSSLASSLHAQVGNDNPTGVAGIFSGIVETGCGYSPYTGNAIRSVVDVSVPGAVVPLALVRTANSRSAGFQNTFGLAGHWNHNYNWILKDSEKSPVEPFQPTSYTVVFPDGRTETFTHSSTYDSGYFRVLINGTNGTPAGVQERFQQLDANRVANLILPDGSKVEFKATRQQNGTSWYYSYVAQAIYDPYGLKTTLTYSNGTLWKVAEPAGRYLEFIYTTVNNTKVIQKVIAHAARGGTRTVTYSYVPRVYSGTTSYTVLETVDCFGEATAHYTYQAPNVAPATGVPLLKICDDPMYSGPMKKIGYVYRTADNYTGNHAVYGQISSENYSNGTTIGLAVSTLEITTATKRTETRADGKTRVFNYLTSGYLNDCTDFMGNSASQHYDSNKWIDWVRDRNGHTTNYTCDSVTGNVTDVQFPAAADVTPAPDPRGTLHYTYQSDYYLNTSKDEFGNITTYERDANNHNRISRILYPDTGWESFTYDQTHFYQLQTHRMTTGGTESFTYYNDGTHLRETYRNPDTANAQNPTAHYQYEQHDRVSDVTGPLGALGDPNATTSYTYNLRGQVTTITFPFDTWNNERRKITNAYNLNGDGTLQSKTDYFNHVNHMTNYSYDDYRRLKSVTMPDRGDGTGTHTTRSYYGANPVDNVNDYMFTDSNVTWLVVPSGKTTNTAYDDNRRKKSLTVGSGGEAATTSYEYDNVGNLRIVKLPLQQAGQQWAGRSTVTDYDARNRPYQIRDADNQLTTFLYDRYGRKKKITRANQQIITYDQYDAMNRVTQQTGTNAGTTYYTYKPSGPAGLLETMKDPRLAVYTYTYDGTGRKILVEYPPASDGTPTGEAYWYDPCPTRPNGPNLGTGTLYQYTNRNGKTQTFGHDNLNRIVSFSWDDTNPHTPDSLFHYDGASRLTDANTENSNITVHREYFDDGLLKSETENTTPLGGASKTVSYSYNADGNRSTITYPSNAYVFNYTHNSRNQCNGIASVVSYGYDLNGNMLLRHLMPRGDSSYTYDALERVKHIEHLFYDPSLDPLQPTPTPRPRPAWKPTTLDYDYDSVGNRKSTKRGPPDGGICYGDVFGYDLNDQVTGVFLDIEFPDTCEAPPAGDPSISYDGAGNRITFGPYGWQERYAVNALNQYTTRTPTDSPMTQPTPTPRPRPSPRPRPTPAGQTAATYDYAGNMTTGFDGSTYVYDAQNRLISATSGTAVMTFAYDGLNRQVKRTLDYTASPDNGTTFSLWDGWDLIEEYRSGNNVRARYLYGPSGLLKNLTSGNYYFQDGSGSTSHLTDNQVQVIEWYLYDLQGVPSFFDADGNELSASAFGVRHLFTGQQWYSDVGLYDLRNRFYSPDIGRFLQPDPIDFDGDPTNLYRYCVNNPVTLSDPTGLDLTITLYPAGLSSVHYNHIGIGVDGPDTWGFYPAHHLPSDIGEVKGDPTKSGIKSITIHTTDEQDQLVRDYIAYVKEHPGLYSFTGNNCARFVERALRAAHIKKVPGTPSPNKLMRVLQKTYGGSTGRKRNSVRGGRSPRENRVGPFGVGPFGSPFGPGGGGPWGGIGPGFGPTGGPGDFGPTGYEPGPIDNYWDPGNEPQDWDPFFDTDPLWFEGPSYDGSCFVAGTPVLMASGSEKPIESVEVGEAVLAWNEETRQIFSTKVVKVLHHSEKMQTLFDIELDDGRTFTVNNDHPIYVVEDDEFTFTDELATRFAKGETITFQDNNNHLVKIASLRMRREICKMYNLHVEGQGKKGHTYYANGVLVHNQGNYRLK